MIEFLGALTIVGLLTYARSQIQSSQMTTGEFTSFIVALLMLYEPVKRLTGIHNIFQQALGASQKVFEYLDMRSSIHDRENATTLPAFRDVLRFDHVRSVTRGRRRGSHSMTSLSKCGLREVVAWGRAAPAADAGGLGAAIL
jgi:subfamily B ATP-binding cassette protein MsbA